MCMIAGSATAVEALRGELAQAKEQARVNKAVGDKAAEEVKSEQVVRRQYEERVTEVEQALKDATGKCESLEEESKAEANDRTKALQEAKEAWVKSQAAQGDQASRTDSG